MVATNNNRASLHHCRTQLPSTHRTQPTSPLSIRILANPCWLATCRRPRLLPSPSLLSLRKLELPAPPSSSGSRDDYSPPCHLQTSQNHLQCKMARCLCYFLLGPVFHLSLVRHHVNCLPAVNQRRSNEISPDGMVCLRHRVLALCLPRPLHQLGELDIQLYLDTLTYIHTYINFILSRNRSPNF